MVRLNVQEDVGRAIAGRYGLSAVPTFIVLKNGSPEARFVGFPNARSIVSALLGG